MNDKEKIILVLNCGSSSIKFSLVEVENEVSLLVGLAEKVGTDKASLECTMQQYSSQREKLSVELEKTDYESVLIKILTIIAGSEWADQIIGIGHRVVHGGEKFNESTLIDKAVLNGIEECINLAPLHNPANLLGIKVSQKQYPKLPQVAVFDTSFHHTLPDYAYLYALPYELYSEHQIRRYGFHGPSHRYVTQKATQLLQKEHRSPAALVSAHLGNGCSVAAVLNGKSLDTSMGLTPLEGLVMGTRSGDIDPSIPTFLIEQLGYSAKEVDECLNKKSGLTGISGVSNDMRELHKAVSKDCYQSKVALEVFCYRLAKYIAASIVPLTQIDALIFTGGIGENDSWVRARTLNWLQGLGFHVDNVENRSHGDKTNGIITTKDSRIALVVPTNEELMIAKDTIHLIEIH